MAFRLTNLLAGLRPSSLPPQRRLSLSKPPATVPPEGDLAGLAEAARWSILDPLGREASRGIGPGVVGKPWRASVPFRQFGLEAFDAARGTLGVAAKQIDQTTCGSAVLVMLAMAGDARLAAWVSRDPAARWEALQRVAKRATSRGGLVPWPSRLGTAPWAAASQARFGGVRYGSRVVGDGERGAEVMTEAVSAACAGIPVPLYSGGDLSGGWQAAVPRHVVLLVDVWPGDETLVRIYDPSSALVHTLPAAVLARPDLASVPDREALKRALGGWPHPVWAILPR